jgi:predicted acetyltransferase
MLRQKSFNADRQVYEYDILNPEGERVGMAQLRLIPSKSPEMPEGFESHIYYEIEPEYRNKGYATRALKELIREAKKHRLDRVIATVDADNPASIKVIEKCGGKFISTGKTMTGQSVLKYQLR